MNRSFSFLPLVVSLALSATACSTMVDLEKSGPLFDEETDCDTGGTDGGSESLMPDTGTDDTGTDDTGGTDCVFEVMTAGGTTVIMNNELAVSIGYGSPEGRINPDDVEHLKVLRITYTAVHPECPALDVSNPRLMGLWSDMAESGWMPEHIELIHVTEGDGPGDGVIDDRGGFLYVDWSYGFIVEGGESQMLDFYADVSGGSMELDDEFHFDLPENTVTVSEVQKDGVTDIVIANPTVGGGMQVL